MPSCFRRRQLSLALCFALLLSVSLASEPDASGDTPAEPEDSHGSSGDSHGSPAGTPAANPEDESHATMSSHAEPEQDRGASDESHSASEESHEEPGGESHAAPRHESTPAENSHDEPDASHGAANAHSEPEEEGHGAANAHAEPEDESHGTANAHSEPEDEGHGAANAHSESEEESHGEAGHAAGGGHAVVTTQSGGDGHGENAAHGGEHGEGEEVECEEHHGGADVVLLLFFMVLLGLAVRYALRSVPVPYTALLLVVGLLLGVMQVHMTKRGEESDGHGHGGHGGVRVPEHNRWEKFAIGIDAWQGIQPELMLLVFLPALIFSSAFSMEFHITKRSFGQVLMLAGPGVVIGTVLTATFVKHVFPYDWCWPKCFMFGAMISATDPVAVVALLKEVGASKRLGTVIEGESLFNDGTAFVFFLLFRDMIPATSSCLDDEENCAVDDKITAGCSNGLFEPQGCFKDRSILESITFFLQLALGGPAIGILFGFTATFWIQYIYNDLLTEISVTLVTAYLTFYVAEDVAEVSGVLAVVSLGLFMGSFAKDRISSTVHEPMHVFWEMMEYLANTLIFVYTGLKISVELFDTTNPNSEFIGSREWGYAVLLYFVLQVIRFVTIFALLPILSNMGYGMTWRDALVAVWGGLRGAIGLALALIVQLDVANIPPAFRSYTIFFLGFVVCATLLINGTTMPYLLKLLGVTKTSPEKLEVLLHLLNDMEDCGDKRAMNTSDDLLGDPDYSEIRKLTALDVAKIVPAKREVEAALESAASLNRPAGLSIQHSLNQQSMSRLRQLHRHSLAGIREEGEPNIDGRIVEVGSEQTTTGFVRVLTGIARWYSHSKSKSGPLPDSPRKDSFTPDMLVQDLRSRLLQGVKTAYGEWLEKGYINAKQMFDLIASSDHAIDKLDEPVSDWKYIDRVAKPSQWRVDIQQLNTISCTGPVGEIASKSIQKLLFDSMLHSVLLARTFIMAHTEAEHTLHEYIKKEMVEEEERADPGKMRMMEDAVNMVIHESQESTKHAYELLRNFRMVYPELLRAIKTRLAAQEVLLEKQEFLHHVESAGLIEGREATVIRDMIDAKIKYLTYNALVLELPSSREQLHSNALFIGMPKTLFDSQVWPHAKPKVFQQGEKIYSIGGMPRHVTIVLRGLVKMVDSHGRESPIGDGFGSVLGVSEIILNRPRAVTMICETTSEVIQFDRQVFESFVEHFVSVRIRSWQLTGMMLTFLNPWGDFATCSILDLAALFRTAQLLEFEADDELRVRTRSYLVAGTVQEAGFQQETPTSISAPAPLGPGLGIYNCITAVKVLRIPSADEVDLATSSALPSNRRRMMSRSSTSLGRVSLPMQHANTMQPHMGFGASRHHLMEIPEGSTADDSPVPFDREDRRRSISRRPASFDHAFSADMETRREMSRKLSRRSIEF